MDLRPDLEEADSAASPSLLLEPEGCTCQPLSNGWPLLIWERTSSGAGPSSSCGCQTI